MRRRIGRRTLFFLVTAVICAALVPAAPSAYRWVAWASAGLAGWWAVLFALEGLFGAGFDEPIRSVVTAPEPEMPFPPPPPPGGARS